ncbi:LON peptidase substrate-binding domain-containing protein [Methylobrevis albus]|uniref:LON peptidase substrate-binding domain-containing protein n=1 Tax=Methylobrevis albus TaxID=2793297 RepID=A0A931HZX8_9HYPH|nr:LON peptidase substrate-binding domain-containing protein [Methylobrevis albus]MBH0237812.1 LON peptidase substrate-binding domain-containing protein [Methylobrevis albus]
MMVGNAVYDTPADLPAEIPVFPLTGALLLPRGQLPLNIFEPRYLAMIDAALGSDRLVGMVQYADVAPGGAPTEPGVPADLRAVGCAGRITSFGETGDGRYHIALTGVTRFRILAETTDGTLFRTCRVTAEPFAADFHGESGGAAVDRSQLLRTFEAYLEANDLEADWDGVERATNEALVNALSMMSPFGPAEKQALLEAPDLKTRADTLVAITEMALERQKGGGGAPSLQ